MRYLCLGYPDDAAWNLLGECQKLAIAQESAAREAALRRNGNLIEQAAIERGGATTLRFDGSKVNVTDGPFDQPNEQLGLVLVIEATDLNHAIQLMSHLPRMRAGGSVEIRPIDQAV